MTQEKGNFTEQAVNKFIELVLSRLVDAERLQVRIKSNLKKLGRGELDALTIQMSNFLLRRNLRVAEFQLDIGAAAVNIQSVMRRQIELLHPSEGKLRIVINQEQLTAELNNVNCELRTDGAILFHFNWIDAEKTQSATYITTPKIEGNKIVLNLTSQEPPTELVNQAISQMCNILNLNDIAHRGTSFIIQQIDIEAGKVTVQANANIEQFPSA
ncbi:MAG TPA: DUF2993 domain-containing protein [Phormidium sp.]